MKKSALIRINDELHRAVKVKVTELRTTMTAVTEKLLKEWLSGQTMPKELTIEQRKENQVRYNGAGNNLYIC